MMGVGGRSPEGSFKLILGQILTQPAEPSCETSAGLNNSVVSTRVTSR